MLYLFHSPGNGWSPEFIKAFKNEKAVNKFIERDIKLLRETYPKERWGRNQYFVAKRVK